MYHTTHPQMSRVRAACPSPALPCAHRYQAPCRKKAKFTPAAQRTETRTSRPLLDRDTRLVGQRRRWTTDGEGTTKDIQHPHAIALMRIGCRGVILGLTRSGESPSPADQHLPHQDGRRTGAGCAPLQRHSRNINRRSRTVRGTVTTIARAHRQRTGTRGPDTRHPREAIADHRPLRQN